MDVPTDPPAKEMGTHTPVPPAPAGKKPDPWMARLSRGVNVTAIAVEFWTWLMILGGIVAGIVIAVHSDTVNTGTDPFGDTTTSTTHPFVAAGIGIIIGSIALGLLYLLLARVSRLLANHIANQYQ